MIDILKTLTELEIDFTAGCKSAKVEYLKASTDDLPSKSCMFISSKDYLSTLESVEDVLLITKDIVPFVDGNPYIIVENPSIVFFKLHNFLASNPNYRRKNYSTIIGDNCKIHESAVISNENVTIGQNVTIEEFVSIKENTTIKDNTIIRPGAVIGGEGFQAKRIQDGKMKTIAHLGGTIIGENVDIQNNTCIDKGLFPWDDTIISNNCVIDNLVHIAHSVKVGKNTLIGALALVAGNTVIGDSCWIAPKSSIINRARVGNDVFIGLGSLVVKDVENGTTVYGHPAKDHSK